MRYDKLTLLFLLLQYYLDESFDTDSLSTQFLNQLQADFQTMLVSDLL